MPPLPPDVLGLIRLDLEVDEGFVPHVYRCPAGKLTIGYGRNLQGKGITTHELDELGWPASAFRCHQGRLLIDGNQELRITRDQAAMLLDSDIQDAWIDACRLVPDLPNMPDTVKRGVTNMSFQMGYRTLSGFHNTLRLIRARKFRAAARNALRSKWAKQTPNRARRVTDFIAAGETA